jgi:hypothetical protein
MINTKKNLKYNALRDLKIIIGALSVIGIMQNLGLKEIDRGAVDR